MRTVRKPTGVGHWIGMGAAMVAMAGPGCGTASAQIDPVERRLLHLGYNQPTEGKSPLSVYAFYLHNQTNFLRPDWTLRAAVAPVWLDAELGWAGLLGERTDVGLILAGGGFARTYNELRRGKWEQGESFTGHGFTVGSAVYHRFNPGQRLPLNGVVAVTAEGSYFERDDETARDFELPRDHVAPVARVGLRLGGREPDLRSPLALEVSTWYEGQWRIDDDRYGFAGDRRLEEMSHLAWARILGRWTSSEHRHDVEFSLTGGTGTGLDRFSVYRVGGMLPFASEFPLMIPGYLYQEFSARNFLLLSGNYSFAVVPESSWRLAVFGATSSMAYLEGLEYPGSSHSGVGGGITWRAPRKDWIVSAFYGRAFDAIRGEDRGADLFGLVLQYDFRLQGGWERYLAPSQLGNDVLRLFGR
ncbi:MAG: hypothetical protein KF833_14495 [Verrucomicrobiae bacterium]|nr:hypothetical protein [Verrucomicrobiae bacterium]